MNKSFFLPALFVLGTCMAGCQSNEVMESKNIAQSEIHQAYMVTYDENDAMLTVNAEFRAAGPNGTTLVLSEPSDVTCDGTEMKLDTYLLGGAYYTYQNQGSLASGTLLSLKFIDLDKKTYVNGMEVYGIGIDEQLSNLPDLKKGQTNEISLKMNDLEDGETFKLNLQGDSVSVVIDNPGEGTAIIHPDKLAGFGTGEKVTLWFERSRSGKLQQTTQRGGTYSVTSYSRKVEATVR